MIRQIVVFSIAAVLASPVWAEVKFTRQDGKSTGGDAIMAQWRQIELARGETRWWPWNMQGWDVEPDGKVDYLTMGHHGNLCGGKLLRVSVDSANGQIKLTDATPELGDHRLLAGGGRCAFFDFGTATAPRSGRTSLYTVASTKRNIQVLADGKLAFIPVGYGGESRISRILDRNADGYLDLEFDYRDDAKSYLISATNQRNMTFKRLATVMPVPAELPQSIKDKIAAEPIGNSRGPFFHRLDADGDGDQEIYVQWDASYSGARWGAYTRNDGGALVDVTGRNGIPPTVEPFHLADVNGDGMTDVYTCRGTGSGLYVRQPDGMHVLSNSPDLSGFCTVSAVYCHEGHSRDFDQDGDLDFMVSNRRSKRLRIYDNQGDGTMKHVLTLAHWDADGFDIGDLNGDGKLDVIIGGSGDQGTEVVSGYSITLYVNSSPSLLPKLEFPEVMRETPARERYLAWCRKGLPPNPLQYGQKATDFALAYRMTGEEPFALRAVELAEAQVRQAELDSPTKPPRITFDRYLYAGRYVGEVASTLAWCPGYTTPEQRDRWVYYLKQAIFNIWNAKQATWYGVSYPSTGVGTGGPGNNYNFSFTRATLYYAIATGDRYWLDWLEHTQFPAIGAYYAKLAGGGSDEGTGYGTAQITLFDNILAWNASTGQRVDKLSTHPVDSVLYWLHCTTPGFRYHVPSGDLARDTAARIVGFHRGIVLQTTYMARDDPAVAAQGRWWLGQTTGLDMAGDMIPLENLSLDDLAPAEPAARHYFAPGLGHLFARSSWSDANATFVWFNAGPREKLIRHPHAHHDVGAVQVFARGAWQVCTANRFSGGGLHQSSRWQSSVDWRKVSDPATSAYHQRGWPTVKTIETDGTSSLACRAELASILPAVVKTWNRSVEYDFADRVTITDEVLPEAGWQPYLVLPTPTQPVVESGAIRAGNVRITFEPAESIGRVVLVDLKANFPFMRSGWKIELPISGTHRTMIEVVQ